MKERTPYVDEPVYERNYVPSRNDGPGLGGVLAAADMKKKLDEERVFKLKTVFSDIRVISFPLAADCQSGRPPRHRVKLLGPFAFGNMSPRCR